MENHHIDDSLYVVVPYFNFKNSKYSQQNLKKLINEFSSYCNTKLIIVEGITSKADELGELPANVYDHIKVYYEDVLWIKENLINIALKKCNKWKYAAWIDRDIKFTDINWALNVIDELRNCDILQPYSKCKYLDREGVHSSDESGFFNKPGTKESGMISFCCGALGKGPKNGAAMHPGHAWAISRTFYNKIDKLFELAVVGGADCVIVEAIRQNKNHHIYKHYGQPFFTFCDKFKECKIGYVDGTIQHRYHGDLKQRNYGPRMEIFTKRGFNVSTELQLVEDKVCLSKTGKLYKHLIDDYFTSKEKN